MEAIIFDFDGLILETESPSFQVWQQIYNEHGAHLDRDLWVSCVGANYDYFHPCTHLEKLIGKKVDHEKLIQQKNDLKFEICNKLPLLPGVIEKIDEAKALNLKLAIASSSPAEWVLHHTKSRKIFDDFAAIAAGSEVKKTKPSPDVYLLAMKRLEVKPENCLVFEDSKNGITAAKAAGIKIAVAVPNPITSASDFSHADLRLSSLNDKTISEILSESI